LPVSQPPQSGLKGVSNPSRLFLSSHEKPVPGSCVLATLEGTRPLLVEIQALVDAAHSPNPRRLSVGLSGDSSRSKAPSDHGHAFLAVRVPRAGNGRASALGAGLSAVLRTGCGGEAREGQGSCIIAPLSFAPFGAGVGLAMGALIPQMRTVYRAPENAASVSRPRNAIGVQASLLEDLALRVNLDDQLRVEDRSGVRTTGRLTRLTADEITIRTSTGEKQFTRETVRQVVMRRQPLRMAVLIGAGVGAATGAVAACTGPNREECADAPIMAGAFGAGVGLAVGALIHRTTIVYPEPEKRTFVLPVISRGAVGVRASLRW